MCEQAMNPKRTADDSLARFAMRLVNVFFSIASNNKMNEYFFYLFFIHLHFTVFAPSHFSQNQGYRFNGCTNPFHIRTIPTRTTPDYGPKNLYSFETDNCMQCTGWPIHFVLHSEANTSLETRKVINCSSIRSRLAQMLGAHTRQRVKSCE